jgi:hypothetical protein
MQFEFGAFYLWYSWTSESFQNYRYSEIVICKVFYKQKLMLVRKFQCLVSQRNEMEVKVLGNFVVNCSKYALTDS